MKRVLAISGMVLALLVPVGSSPASAHNADYCTEHFQTSADTSFTERGSIQMTHRWTLRLKYKKCWANNGLVLDHMHPINFRLRMVQENEKRCDTNGPPDDVRAFRMNPSNIGRWDFAEREWDCVTGQTYYTKWIDFAGLERDRILGTKADRCFQFHWQVDLPLISDPEGISPNACV